MTNHSLRRNLALTLATVAISLLAQPVYAYFTGVGAGSGSGTAGTLQTSSVYAIAGGDSVNTPLLPGGTGDAILRVHNPNSFAVTLVSVTGNGTITTSNNTTCNSTNDAVSFANQSSLSVSIPASGSTGSTLVRLTGSVSMGTGSANACQGVTFYIPVTITARYP
jgi:hypothetical protein